MLESLMFIVLGFLLASVLSVLLAPPLWRRAVRLTTRRIESTMPMSVADIQADKDELRAEFAIKLRQLELALEKTKDQSARHLVERNRNQVMARQLKDDLTKVKEELSARSSQTTVLQQNVTDRIPQLEAQYAKARDAIASREDELEKLKKTLKSQSDALSLAKQNLKVEQQKISALTDAKGQGIALKQEVDTLQAENQRLVVQMANFREHLSMADTEALKALKLEKQRIEADLETVKSDRGEMDHPNQQNGQNDADVVASMRADNKRLAEDVARLERELQEREGLSEGDVAALRHEIQGLASQLMEDPQTSNISSGQTTSKRSRKTKSSAKSTGEKPSQRQTSTAKPPAQSAVKNRKSSPPSGSTTDTSSKLRTARGPNEMVENQAD